MKLRTACRACALCLLLPLTACTPKVAVEPTATPAQTPLPGANNLVVVNGVPIGFVSWEWLEFDGLAQYSTAEELIDAAERQFVNFS